MDISGSIAYIQIYDKYIRIYDRYIQIYDGYIFRSMMDISGSIQLMCVLWEVLNKYNQIKG